MTTLRIFSCALALSVLAGALGVNAAALQCNRNHFILDAPIRAWIPTGNLNVSRSAHTATLLPDGRVLVAGGRGASAALDSAELYDPATGSWALTGSLAAPRVGHTATLLPNGEVLVVGGDRKPDPHGLGLGGTAELYDPTTGRWRATANLKTARVAFTATLLATGRVLVAGGVSNSDESLDSSELYDPDSGTWGFTGKLITPRFQHTATPLRDGRILVVAGWIDDFFQTVTADAELYDPLAGTWSSAAGLYKARMSHTATRLQDGKVLVAGGYETAPSYVPTSFVEAELYDPANDAWTVVGDLVGAREGHTATPLPDGEVLVVGGFDWNTRSMVNGAELYEAASATWVGAATGSPPRESSSATLLFDGSVLVAGGYVVGADYSNIPRGDAALYAAIPNTIPCRPIDGTLKSRDHSTR